MPIKSMKCENCGALIKYNNKQQLICPNCGSLYSEQQEINKTYVNNSVVKNYYGTENMSEIDNEKITGYIGQIVNCIKNANYSEARRYCNIVIEKDPYSWIATIFKGFIENSVKQSNGRYKTSFTLTEMFVLLEYSINDEHLEQYYDIFFYYKILLQSLEPKGSNEVLELCDKYLEALAEIEFEDVQDFVSELKNFRDRVKELNDTSLEEEREERIKMAELNDILSVNKKLKFTLKLMIIIAIILFFFAFK